MKSWDLCLDLFIYNTVQGGRIEWQFNIVLFSRSYVKLTNNQPRLVFQKMWLVGLWWYDEWWWSPGQIVSKYTYLSYRFFLKNSNQVYRLVAVEYIYSSVTSPGQGKPQLTRWASSRLLSWRNWQKQVWRRTLISRSFMTSSSTLWDFLQFNVSGLKS